MAKYDALAAFLAQLPDDQSEVVLTFGRIDGLVGGLPPSARRLRNWWANNSQVQSLSWRRSEWHVHSVDLAGSTVVFVRGQVGGSYAARSHVPASLADGATSDQPVESTPSSLDSAELCPANAETVDARVSFSWVRLGSLQLDSDGKLAFPGVLPAAPGLYPFTMVTGSGRHRIYVGESDNLRRRLSTNYRNPGPRQRTSLRVNALLVAHLRSGADVKVDVSTAARLHVQSAPEADLDLGRKAGRLLAESAALVIAQCNGDVDIANMG